MGLYGGMDLGSRQGQVWLIHEEVKIWLQEKVQNELPRILRLSEPYQESLKIVGGSTFSWYCSQMADLFLENSHTLPLGIHGGVFWSKSRGSSAGEVVA